MTCLTNFLNKIAALSAIVFLALPGCAAGQKAAAPPAGPKSVVIAVLPIENLSGAPAPLKEIRRTYIQKLLAHGISVLDDNDLEGFLARHGVRFTGGIDRETASLFKEETGVQGVLITSLEYYNALVPPKVSVISRLVTAGPEPKIEWMDSYGSSGDDNRGLLDIGYIYDAGKLMDRTLERLSGSLAASLKGSAPAEDGGRKKFRPKYYYKAPEFDLGQRYRVAVAPFFNRSDRRGADEIMMLLFIKYLYDIPNLEVLEPGVVREDLLRHRVVMEEGLSLRNVDLVMLTLNADLIVMGRVFDYQDYQGTVGSPKVDFTVQVVGRKSMSVVWSSKSRNEGNEGVFFFDTGKVNTADAMASEMVWNVVRIMEEK